MKIVTVEEMRSFEARCEAQGISTDTLMENAGRVVAEKVRRRVGDLHSEHIIVLVGPGSNGGDGLVAARHFSDWGAKVHVVLCAPRKEPDPKMLLVLERGVDVIPPEKARAALAKLLPQTRLVLDALLGTGRARPLQGAMRDALQSVMREKRRRGNLVVVALDLPTGLDADTGLCDPATPQADVTIALGFPKVGMLQPPGSAKVGKLEVVDIGVPADLARKLTLTMATPEWARSVLPIRPADANKGTFGRVLVVAGSGDYVGAAYLACAGALRTGSGLVTLATPKSLSSVIATMLPEVTHLPLVETAPGVVKGEEAASQILKALASYDALLIGCGLSKRPEVASVAGKLLSSLPANLGKKTVIDADALNILAELTNWHGKSPKGAIVTPHPGEMSRLLGKSVKDIQSNRMEVAKKASQKWQKVVLLKGAYSVIANPDGRLLVNPFANPALATAGTGDVLSGVVVSLLGQGLSGFEAAALGAYLHASAGELARTEVGDTGVIASDLLLRLPKAITAIRR